MNKPVKVLIVEDSEADAEVALRALRQGGFDPTHRRVQTAAELETALAQERWDAVISDFRMPGFTGLDALSICRSDGLDLPFILVSGTIGEETAADAMKAGASDYVMKTKLARLAPALERELKQAAMRVEHRLATKELSRSESLRGAILDASLDCVIAIDHEGKIVEFNPASERTFGLTRDQALGKFMVDLIVPPRLRDAHRRGFAHYLATGKGPILDKRLELEAIRADGTEFPIELTITAIGAASTPMLTGFIRDITERKNIEKEIHDTKNFLASIFDNIPNSIFVKDAQDLQFLRINAACETLTGYSEKEFLGKSDYDLFPKEQADFFVAKDRETLAGTQRVSVVEETITSRDGTQKLLQTKKFPILGKDGHPQYLLGMSEDITERKQAEHRIKHLNRVYAMLSGINALIVRVRDRDELFTEACRLAVEGGGFRMSLIGIVDRNSLGLVPVASSGKDEKLMAAIKGILSSSEGAPTTMVARTIRDKAAVVSNDSQNDPDVVFGEKYAKAGVRSIAILPLIVANEAVGVLALYASESEFFHTEEMKLLTDLASNIAFAIDHIEKGEKLTYLAYYDALTGLANRTLFLERVAQYIRSAVSGGHKLAVFILDLERFKNINDSLGRPAGDALLKQVTEFLSRDSQDPSLLARLGTDHFAIVVPELKRGGNIASLLDRKMRAFLDHPFRLNDAELRLPIKVGGAIFPHDGTDADTLLQNAEAALKKAKASGDRYLFYTQRMTAAVASNLTLENQLRQALDKEEFVLHYQPKVNLASGKLTGAEALIRWNDPRTGLLVPPGRFIPILEQTGLINEVGRWALRKAIEDYLRWRAAGLAAVRIAVNVSALQLRSRGFVDEIRQAIAIDAHAAAALELEITESLIMEDVQHNIASLQTIRAMGVRIAIDDFGTGFSSLSYLSKLPVDTLKIDRSFVIDMTAGPEGLALVSTIIGLARSLKLNVVAEGVETEEQSRLLRAMKCDEMQGFLFSKPVPGEIFETSFLAPSSVPVASFGTSS